MNHELWSYWCILCEMNLTNGLFPLSCLRTVDTWPIVMQIILISRCDLTWDHSSLLNFPAFPMFSRALRLSPLTPLWLWSSGYLNVLIVQCVHHCAGNGLGSHRDPLFSFLPVQKYSLNGFAFSSGSPQRRFLIAVLQGSFAVWSLCQAPMFT